MRHLIAVAVFDRISAFEYSLAAEILGRDRRELTEDWYEFLPCRVEPGPQRSSHGFAIEPAGTLEDMASADTLLVTGWRDPEEKPPEAWLETLRRAHAGGARVVSICTGAFVLAYAGLLDGRIVTTHWLHADTLRRLFPKVRVDEDALYLHDRSENGWISTSAGCAAGLDLCLALVREDHGLSVANAIARRMVAPAHREGGQTQYAEAPVGVAEHDRFGPVLDWMIEHLSQPIAIDEVARRFGFSLRTFQRRFKEILGLSPHQWLVGQRLSKARELLESTDLSVERIADLAGLGSAANLRKYVSRELGTTPRAYRSTFRGS